MKQALLTFLILTTAVSAMDSIELYHGLKSKTLNVQKVRSSTWLNSHADKLSSKHDFHENVSYVGENWDSVSEYCEFTSIQSDQIYHDSEIYVAIDWNKMVTKKLKSKAYILYLFSVPLYLF